ncbi:MAG: GHKL domain-containing protein [Anaerolineales bacterium]|nr:GHKL domain-containing protein [Anaerolineales bacterium]
MNTSHNPIIRLWKWWFTTRSTDPTVIYRERALRVLLPITILLRGFGIQRAYSGAPELTTPFFPLWVNLFIFIVPIMFSIYFLVGQKVGWAGVFYLLHWNLTDLLSLSIEGYWYSGYQISIILQGILGTLLLPSNAILFFLIFQLTVIGGWGHWLDMNYYDPPLLSSGQPFTDFWTTFITLAAQESMIVFIVRYLRLQMETSLQKQRGVILQLGDEIEQRRHLQNEREQYIDELNKKNAELERFAYTVSHDLRNPLVTIKGFIGMLKKDVKENRPERAEHDMQRIAHAADKMDALLSELLELSRIGRVVNPPEEIDCRELVQDTLDLLDAKILSSNVKIVIADVLPVLYGDRIRLLEVFENLIDNAIKYMGDQPEPVIEIGTRNTAGQQVIFIKDNGIGVDAQYHTKIFGLFEKLDATVEGTGIGLALVKRIIETHHGWVWIESEGLGKGSTFCFTIPDDKK